MPYQFAVQNKDYSDYASGRVFYAAPKHPAFPVRLISELFQRCQAVRQGLGLTHPATIYDPCCGGAYHLSTLAYLHWHEIDTIIGSDIDANILSVAARNLSLLTQPGLEKRAGEIEMMHKQYGKPSHAAALESASRFDGQLRENLSAHPINTRLFEADAIDGQAIKRGLDGRQIDILLADIPYGNRSNWLAPDEGAAVDGNMLWQMLDALLAVVTNKTVVAIVADKAQRCSHERYERAGRFQIGKRRITLLRSKE